MWIYTRYRNLKIENSKNSSDYQMKTPLEREKNLSFDTGNDSKNDDSK